MQRSFNEMQTWITELRQLGPQNLVLAIAANKLDLEHLRQVSGSITPLMTPMDNFTDDIIVVRITTNGFLLLVHALMMSIKRSTCYFRYKHRQERHLQRMPVQYLWRLVLRMVQTYKNYSGP